MRRRVDRAVVVSLLLLVARSVSGQGLTLAVSVDRQSYYPGDRLELSVSARNTSLPTRADFYSGLILPDGVTIATVDGGGGVRLGSVARPAAFLPLARGISLSSPFSAAVEPLFRYAWTGAEPLGRYTVFLAAVREGGFADDRIDGDDILAVQFGTLVVQRPATTTSEGTPVAVPITVDEGGTISVTSQSGARFDLVIPPGAVVADTTVTATAVSAVTGLPVDQVLAAVRFQPDGLHLRQAATLTLTMPAPILPLGLVGFTVADDGTGFAPLPVTVDGRTATIRVAHFSSSGLAVSRCGPSVTTAIGRDACSRIADELTTAATMLAEDPTRVPLPVRVLLAAEVYAQLRPWLASITRSMVDASDAANVEAAQHHFLIVALRELLVVEAITELLAGLGVDEALAPDLAAARARIAPAIGARRLAANTRCLAPVFEERQNTSVYVARLQELAAEEAARGLPVDTRTGGITCLRLAVDVLLPQTIPPAGAALTVIAVLRFADGLPMLDPRMQRLGHTIEVVDRGLAEIAEPRAANGFQSVVLETTVRRRSPVGTLALEIRADVPSIGFSVVQQVTRAVASPGWTITDRLVRAQVGFVTLPELPGGFPTRNVMGTSSAVVPDETISIQGGSMSVSNLRTTMVTSAATSPELVVDLTGSGRITAGTTTDHPNMFHLVDLAFQTDRAFMCQLEVLALSRVPATPPARVTLGVPYRFFTDLRRNGVTIADRRTVEASAPFACGEGQYQLRLQSTTQIDVTLPDSTLDYRVRLRVTPVAAAPMSPER